MCQYSCSSHCAIKEFSAREVWDRPNCGFWIHGCSFVAQHLNHKTWDEEATSSDANRRAFMFQEVYCFIHKTAH